MNRVTAHSVRTFILNRLQAPLSARSMDPSDVPDDYDLLTEGIIDSMGIVELIAGMEQQFGIQLSFEDLDPESLTIIGPLCRYIELKSCATDNTTFSYG
jgi:acyl carrier protein